MQSNKTNRCVRADGHTRFCLTTIVVLLAMLAAVVWVENVRFTRRAEAAEKLFDTVSQRNEIVAQQKITNAKLGELISLLKSGQVKVKLVTDDDKKAGGTNVVGKVQPKK